MEPEETASLETHIGEVGGAYRLGTLNTSSWGGVMSVCPGQAYSLPSPSLLEQHRVQTGAEDGMAEWDRAWPRWTRYLIFSSPPSLPPLSAVCLCCCLFVQYVGRREPIPFELKDDNMGLGRWSYEVRTLSYVTCVHISVCVSVCQLEQAQDATDKRKQLETEKEITADLVEKYKVYT